MKVPQAICWLGAKLPAGKWLELAQRVVVAASEASRDNVEMSHGVKAEP